MIHKIATRQDINAQTAVLALQDGSTETLIG